MGIQYQIKFAHQSELELDAAIRELPYFVDFDPPSRLYNLWLEPDRAIPGEMPDAWVAIDSDGIYCCLNRSAESYPIRDALVASAERFQTEVIVDEL
ncbi:MAG: hypothetical protein WDZ51_03370 [Pirellulaceae bacterium]